MNNLPTNLLLRIIFSKLSNILVFPFIIQVELFVHFTVNPKPPVKFSSIPRSSRRKEYVARRFGRTDVRWGYSGTSDQIKFVVDKKIFIKGFGLYGSIHGPSEYECIIMLIDTTTGKEIASNATGYACDGSAKACRVMFKKPVEIYPDTGYTACATLKVRCSMIILTQ